MPYRFKLDEKFGNGFRRIVREQVALAAGELSAPSISAGAIHQTRKVIKRLRALIRTAGPSLGAKAARKHDRVLRDIGRQLSSRRDDDVIESAIASLEARYGGSAAETLRPLRNVIESERGGAVQTADPQAIADVRAALKSEGKRLRKLRLNGYGLASAVEGTSATYATGRRALKRAIKDPSDHNVHEFRKSVQAHWRHMALFSRGWTEEFAVRVAAARELSQILGDDHDLVLVKLAAHNALENDAASIVDLCNQRQDELRDAMKFRALRLYAEEPDAFTRRITMYWKTAAGVKAPDSDVAATAKIDKPNGAAEPSSTSGSHVELAAKTPG